MDNNSNNVSRSKVSTYGPIVGWCAIGVIGFYAVMALLPYLVAILGFAAVLYWLENR